MSILEPVGLSGAGERRRIRTSSPTNGESHPEHEVASAADVARAVARAREAQVEWAALPVAQRARCLAKAGRHLLDLQAEFSETIRRETGKPELEALGMEVAVGCDMLHFFARRAPRILADEIVSPHLLKNKRARLTYRPRGVVAVISPWNFPFLLSLAPTVQALAAGNAVVLKPSEWTPQSGRLVEELFQGADLPEGLLSCVSGDGGTGDALIHAGVDQVCFTGSVATGRKVAEACGRQLIPTILELGGKDPMIVCADADLNRAASGAVYGAFANAGQMCTSVERLYVVDEVADAFVRKVLEKTAELRQGEDGEIDVGPLSLESQLEKVESHVAAAVASGARVLAGGRRNPEYAGRFYEPTVLVDVNHDMAVMREESFGPVLPIMRVRDEDEALRLANDSPFGLSATVWTRDKRKGVELAKHIEAGSVVVNDCFINVAMTELPFGGSGDSGIGVLFGEQGLRSFCHSQAVAVDRFGARSELFWFPYTGKKLRLLRRFMRLVWGSPIGKFFS